MVAKHFLKLGLLESDTMRIIMGNRDWAQSIAEELGYYVDFVSATRIIREKVQELIGLLFLGSC